MAYAEGLGHASPEKVGDTRVALHLYFEDHWRRLNALQVLRQ